MAGNLRTIEEMKRNEERGIVFSGPGTKFGLGTGVAPGDRELWEGSTGQGGEKGQRQEPHRHHDTHTCARVHTHTQTCVLTDLQSHKLTGSHPHPAPYVDTQAHPPGECWRSFTSPTGHIFLSGFSSFLDYILSLQCALDLGRDQQGT